MSLKATSVKLPPEILTELNRLSGLLSAKESRPVTLSSVIVQAIRYGIPVIQEDLSTDFVIPKRNLPESKRLASAVKQIFEKGIEAYGLHAGVAV